MLKLEWRPRAHLDRESIAIYLAVEVGNPAAALKAMHDIDRALENACLFPEAARAFDHEMLQRHDYRCALAGNYRVFYTFDSTTVTVHRILHQRMDICDYTLVDL